MLPDLMPSFAEYVTTFTDVDSMVTTQCQSLHGSLVPAYRGAGGVGEEAAGGGVAARVVAVVPQPAVALLARLHEPVTADGCVEQRPGL